MKLTYIYIYLICLGATSAYALLNIVNLMICRKDNNREQETQTLLFILFREIINVLFIFGCMWAADEENKVNN